MEARESGNGEEKAQVEREEEERMRTQEENVGEKREEESRSSTDGDNDVSNRHMTWLRTAWWIRVDDGSSMRSARARRRVWRAARRAVEQDRDGDGVGQAHRQAEEAEGKKRGKRKEEKAKPDSTAKTLCTLLYTCLDAQRQQGRQQCTYSDVHRVRSDERDAKTKFFAAGSIHGVGSLDLTNTRIVLSTNWEANSRDRGRVAVTSRDGFRAARVAASATCT